MPSIPEANPPRDNPDLLGEDTTGSTANIPSEAPPLVQDGAVTSIQDANSHDPSKGFNNGATVEDGKQFLVPSAEEETTQQKIDKGDATAADMNHTPVKGRRLSPIKPSRDVNVSNTVANSHDPSKDFNNGATLEDGRQFLVPSEEEKPTQQKIDKNQPGKERRLTPIRPSRDVNVSNTVTSGPDGLRVETIIHAEGGSHLFEGNTRKPDFVLTKVTGVVDTGDRGPSHGINIPPLPVSSLEEDSLVKPLVCPVVSRPVVEGRKLEILKSIVYGGLLEAITSLSVISSAAGSGASTLNILVLGLANLFGGLILIIHSLQELREEEPRRTTTEDNQTNSQEQGRYKRLLGRRENFTLHASVAILSFIITGLLPPVVYYISFSKTQNRDYKVASVFGASLLCIVLLALAKAHVRSPRGSHLKSVVSYVTIAVSVSGISYVVGNFVNQFLEKYGWSDGSETPAGEMMLALMGRKAGSFGYSSSY